MAKIKPTSAVWFWRVTITVVHEGRYPHGGASLTDETITTECAGVSEMAPRPERPSMCVTNRLGSGLEATRKCLPRTRAIDRPVYLVAMRLDCELRGASIVVRIITIIMIIRYCWGRAMPRPLLRQRSDYGCSELASERKLRERRRTRG
jgi:hypothetical protein